MKTAIEWANVVWNPVTGCNKVSQGCKNCYAEKMHKRLNAMGQEKYVNPFTEVVCHEGELSKPLMLKKPSRVFVNSMSDLFHEKVPFDFIDKVFDAIAQASWHTFIVLTKRPERMKAYYQSRVFEKLITNLWVGVSVENQEMANERIMHLLAIPAAVRFLSIEPMLGPIDLYRVHTQNQHGDNFYHNVLNGVTNMQGFGNSNFANTINWVIVGGESGKGARPMHPDWVRSIRNQCRNSNVPFFFKQWGAFAPNTLPFRDYNHWTQKAQSWLQGWRRDRDMCIDVKGVHCTHGAIFSNAKYPVYPMWLLGKDKTGNMLDGLQHLEFPEGGKA